MKSKWRSQRVDVGTVFTHPGLPDVRIQPGPHTDVSGDWVHGVQVCVLTFGEWVPLEGGSFFWVHEAQAWAESELLS